MPRLGRHPSQLKIMPGLLVITAPTVQEAQDKFDFMQELIDPLVGLSQLAGSMGDLTAYPLDGPVPMLPEWRLRSRGQLMYDRAQRDGLTIRQLYMAIAAGNGHRQAIGTPAQVVDHMQHWFENEAADGFNILATHMPAGLDDFVTMVVPELQRRGLFRTAYEGRTLRENLGLARPESRYAARSEAAN